MKGFSNILKFIIILIILINFNNNVECNNRYIKKSTSFSKQNQVLPVHKLNHPHYIKSNFNSDNENEDSDNDYESLDQGSKQLNKPPQSLYEVITNKILTLEPTKELYEYLNQFNNFVHSLKLFSIDQSSSDSKSDNNVHSSIKKHKLTLGEKPISDGLEHWLGNGNSNNNNNNNNNNNKLQGTIKEINEKESSNSDSSDSSSGSSDSSSGEVIINKSTCQLGRLDYSSQESDTCQGDICYIYQIQCNGQLYTLNESVEINPDINYQSDCQLISMICPYSNQPVPYFNFQNQYQLQSCIISNMSCVDQYLNNCTLNEVICDQYTTFGINSFGFTCSTDELVCDGQIVPRSQYPDYSNQIQNGECDVNKVKCSGPKDECLDLSIKCQDAGSNCTLNVNQDTTCIGHCYANLNTSSCICPDDFTGRTCQYIQPFTCNLDFISPIPSCPYSNFIISDKDCFKQTLSAQSTFNYKLNCRFNNPPQPSQTSFNYWINLPNFKVSQPYNWIFKMNTINLNRLYNYSVSNNLQLEKEQMMGTDNILHSFSLKDIPSEYWVAKRIYNEIHVETKYQNITISKYYIKATDYPSNNPKPVSNKKKVLLLVFGSLGIFILVVTSIIFYRKKLKVN